MVRSRSLACMDSGSFCRTCMAFVMHCSRLTTDGGLEMMLSALCLAVEHGGLCVLVFVSSLSSAISSRDCCLVVTTVETSLVGDAHRALDSHSPAGVTGGPHGLVPFRLFIRLAVPCTQVCTGSNVSFWAGSCLFRSLSLGYGLFLPLCRSGISWHVAPPCLM